MARAKTRGRPARSARPKQQELKVEEFNAVQGMETREQRNAIQKGSYSWTMNIQPIGARTLRFMNGKGPTLYTAPGGLTILADGTCIIGTAFYAIVFLSDGSAEQVAIAGGATTAIGSASTFYGGSGAYPAFAAFGNSGIIIVSPLGYWAWDGTTLYAAGAEAPTWLSGETPTFQITGTATNGQPTITAIASTAAIVVGDAWLGAGFVAGTYVTIINSATEVTVSNNFTGTTGTHTFTVNPLGYSGTATNGSANITAMPSTTGIVVGQALFNDSIAGFATGTTVTAIVSGTEITVSNEFTGITGAISFIVDWPMPSGIVGTAIEIYNASPWIVNGRTILASAPANGADFATSDGAVSLTVKDSYVQAGYTGLKQLDGFLYLIAASAVDVISDVQTSGSPASTTFLRVNVSPLIGSPWRDTIVALPSSIAFANATGCYEVAGGQAQKISDSADGIFENATFSANPSACIVTLSETICYGLTLRIADPDTKTAANVLLMWDGKRWFLATQETQPTIVATQDDGSVLTGWGSDGTTLFSMFAVPSTNLTKKSKSWFAQGDSGITTRKMLKRIYAQFGNLPVEEPSLSLTIDTENLSVLCPSIVSTPLSLEFINNSGGIIQFQNNSGQDIFFSVAEYPLIVAGSAPGIICCIFALTLQSAMATLDIVGIAIGYIDYSRWE
jgi:hypothetical protein